jgi:hypothetical protein
MHISPGLAPMPAERSMRSRMSQDWFVESLRVTLFGVPGWTPRPIFAEIAGVLPAQLNAQPAMQFHQEMGNLSDAYLAVTQQAGRLDVVLSDQPTRNNFDPGAPGYRPLYWAGPFKDSIEAFDSISAKALALIPGATRIAFAITVVRQTESVREAVATLQNYLPTVAIDPDNDIDLLFQINRPTRDAKGRFINRLARWEALQVTALRVTVSSGAVPIAPLPAGPPISGARIYADVSTDANNAITFSRDELAEIMSALRAYGISVIEDGDQK